MDTMKYRQVVLAIVLVALLVTESHSPRRVTVVVHNKTPRPAEVRWVDADGFEGEGTEIPPGESLPLHTWVGNALRARGPNARVLGEVVVQEPPEELEAFDDDIEDVTKADDEAAPTAGRVADWPLSWCDRRVMSMPYGFEFSAPKALSLRVNAGQNLGIAFPRVPGENKHFDLSMDLVAAYNPRRVPVQWTRKKICPMCSAFGATRAHLKTCTRCNGTGMIGHHHNLGAAGSFRSGAPRLQTHNTTCPVCEGFGSMPDPDHVCPLCKGERYVSTEVKEQLTLPAGVYTGFEVRYPKMGDEHKFKVTGDVVFAVKVDEHERYELIDGVDLHTELKVTLAEAIGGFNRSMEHPSGVNLKVVRSGMTSPGFTICVKGVGMPHVPSCYLSGYNTSSGQCFGDAEQMERHFGDLFVHVNVGFPSIMSDSSRKRISFVLDGVNEYVEPDEVEDDDDEHAVFDADDEAAEAEHDTASRSSVSDTGSLADTDEGGAPASPRQGEHWAEGEVDPHRDDADALQPAAAYRVAAHRLTFDWWPGEVPVPHCPVPRDGFALLVQQQCEPLRSVRVRPPAVELLQRPD